MIQGTETFEITEDHLKLLKNMFVNWWNCEFGAPAIDCKRPYGNGDVERDIARILGWKIEEDEDGDVELSNDQLKIANKLHEETKTALQICLSAQTFEVGNYLNYEKYCDTKWKKI